MPFIAWIGLGWVHSLLPTSFNFPTLLDFHYLVFLFSLIGLLFPFTLLSSILLSCLSSLYSSMLLLLDQMIGGFRVGTALPWLLTLPPTPLLAGTLPNHIKILGSILKALLSFSSRPNPLLHDSGFHPIPGSWDGQMLAFLTLSLPFPTEPATPRMRLAHLHHKRQAPTHWGFASLSFLTPVISLALGLASLYLLLFPTMILYLWEYAFPAWHGIAWLAFGSLPTFLTDLYFPYSPLLNSSHLLSCSLPRLTPVKWAARSIY